MEHAKAAAMVGVRAIETKGVTRLFGTTPALRNVTVRILGGQLTFLEGPNGAGKSTLLAVLGTVLKPTRGQVYYDPLGQDPAAARREIGWVGHDSHCYKELSARENVQLAARWHGVDPKLAWESVAARVNATPFAERAVGTLSRGQKQRVALARALVHQPSVLLLDEPWSGLDPASAEGLEKVLIEERDRGALVIVVNHSMGLAERLGARRIRLEGGRVVNS